MAIAAEAAELDFNRDIRPILSNHCFACHGPDEANRQGGLRLDDAAAATQPADSGQRAIVPGKPDESQLVARVTAIDAAERMPPAEANKPLSAAQRALLRQWIAEGARRQAHWSLVPPVRPPLPPVSDARWPRSDIDHFILARLDAAGLKPSPEADRPTLIRRLYLDLIGLLPTPEEAAAFAADPRPDAYEQLVDRLLDSPHYGERWARRWLDLARYADTNGYEKDRTRSMWPYRDWVISSLNADMPFDRFTIEQIAGDLLPDATLSERVATGFHRNTMVNEEGGIDVEEFRFLSHVDRVSTTGAVWLGLTVGCAQCHTHKFDPITQQEYYGLFALLNNADELELEVPQAAITAQRAEGLAKITELKSQRDAQLDPAKLAAWTTEQSAAARPWTPLAPSKVESSGHATMTVLDDLSVLATGDKPNQDTYLVELDCPLDRVAAIRLEVLPDASLPQHGPGRAPLFSEGDFMLGEVSLARVDGESSQPLKLGGATHDYAADKAGAELAIDGDLDTGWMIKGRVGQAHQAVFRLAEPLPAAKSAKLEVKLEQRYIHQMTIGRFRLSLTSDEDAKASSLPADVEQILTLAPRARSAEQLAALRQHYLATAPEFAEVNKAIEELRRKLPQQPTTLVMQERAPRHARTTRLHHRGEFLSPRDPVEPGVPAALHALPSAAPRNRLGLAQWLVDPANPLVARVTMNRHWQYLFGRGIVRTTEDFGLRGEAPSHPELLDYLATRFVAGGWSIKQMHRLIVSSATYRQSSEGSAAASERDPDNVLLSRGPRVRVEGETVRDLALAASGLLRTTIGGPSVYPPQPAGVSELAYGGAAWPTSTGDDRYRRGLYTFLKRTSPYAAFMTFDGPSGESCLVRRERSNTPLQALTLLNDTVFVEAARALAKRLVNYGPDTRTRIDYLLRVCLTRSANASELAELEQFYQAQHSHLSQSPAAARAVMGLEGDGEAPLELAAWTLVARAVLNLDEFITRQ